VLGRLVHRDGLVHGSRLVHRGLIGGRGVGSGGRDVGSRSRDVGSRGRSVGGSRSVGGLAVGGGISSLTGVHNIRDKAAVGVPNRVADRLQATVGQDHRVGAGGRGAVALLAGVYLHAVVVVHGVVVGVDGGRVIGGGGVAVAGCVVGDGDGGRGGKNDENLQIQGRNKIIAAIYITAMIYAIGTRVFGMCCS